MTDYEKDISDVYRDNYGYFFIPERLNDYRSYLKRVLYIKHQLYKITDTPIYPKHPNAENIQ